MSKSAVIAGFLPGLPHLLQADRSPAWTRLAQGMETFVTHLQERRPEVIVLYSSQWLSVLGTSFQANPNPKGLHVDENWYDLGDLSFDFPVDTELSKRFAQAVQLEGFPTKTVNFEGFPIDTGTIVALRYLNPKGDIPVCVVSSWVYADATKSAAIGRTMRNACDASGIRAAFVACSLMSSKFSPTEINPKEDKVGEADDQWNKKILSHLESGDFEQVRSLSAEFTKATAADMQFNAFHWLSGVLDESPDKRAKIHAYDAIWGTGASVMEFNPGG